MKQNTIFQAAAIVAAGIVLALVANAFASRDRKVSLAGTYPNAISNHGLVTGWYTDAGGDYHGFLRGK